MSDSPLLTPSQYVDRLQGRGRYTFTRDDAARVLARSAVARREALRRLKQKGRIVAPRRGFYVIVPVEYRSAGAPPPSWFIDDLMTYLGQPYSVGLLTAAAIHGAGHQQPQVFQVITDRPTRKAEVGRVRIEFHRSRGFANAAIQSMKTETGSMRVSTPEQTAIDLVRYPDAAGQLDNIATVLIELAEKIDPALLKDVAVRARQSDVQRLGYLLDQLALESLAASMHSVLCHQHRRPVRLRPDLDATGIDPDDRWYVVANASVEADL